MLVIVLLDIYILLRLDNFTISKLILYYIMLPDFV